MNAGTYSGQPQENTVPTWLLPTHAVPKDAITTPGLSQTYCAS